MNTITVTIGRNVGEVPLYPRAWRDFTDALDRLVGERAEQVFVQAQGCGAWAGVGEDNYTIVASIGAASLRTLPAALARLAHEYLQDAIALTVGTTALVEGAP